MDRSKLVRPLPRRLWARILLGAAVALAASSAQAYEHTWHTLTISGAAPASVSAGQSYSFTPTAVDSRSRTLVFAIANAPGWANFSSQTGQLTGTPGASSVGTYAGIVIAVSDGWRTATLPPFTVQVLAAATASVPPPPNPTVSLSASPTTVSSGGSAMLSWSSSNASSCTASAGWSGNEPTSGSASTGALSATTSYTLTCSGAGGSVSKTVAVTASAPPNPTVILSASPTTVSSGGSAMLSWSSSNASSCTASAGWSGNEPTSGSATTGALSAATSYTLTCSGAGGSASKTVAVNVSAPPTPPVISGTPPTSVMAGSGYAFQPTASDPAGKLLSFSVQNKPAWASFSIASGQLDGTPSSVQTGTYANIVISTSDGTAASALPAFSITVMSPPVTTGSAVLALTPPTQNSDGSALTDLAGMRVYYGTSASSLTQVLDLPGATATTYTLANLASGTWYFAATAYTSGGQESSPSGTASKSIP